jgi:hypothetical protein
VSQEEIIDLIEEYKRAKVKEIIYEELRYMGITLYLQKHDRSWCKVDVQVRKEDIEEL